ncbi:MAG: M23 family metallopeptidase, partial [Patescibacteria group bacterium]
VVFPILIAIILFIINSGAYIVPPLSNLTTSCDSTEKPTAVDTIFSSDGKYVFPLANAQNISLSCTHWDHRLATDIFTQHLRGDQYPVLAYTSGVIEGTSLNDSKGGKYIILSGNDGRYYYYAHNCALFVKAGDSVNVGDVIAVTDNTGSAANTPEHLHFAISKFPNFFNGGTVCPSKEFENKFNLGRCAPANECVP